MGLNNYQNIISICSSTTIPWIYDFFCTFLSRGRSLIFSNRCYNDADNSFVCT